MEPQKEGNRTDMMLSAWLGFVEDTPRHPVAPRHPTRIRLLVTTTVSTASRGTWQTRRSVAISGKAETQKSRRADVRPLAPGVLR